MGTSSMGQSLRSDDLLCLCPLGLLTELVVLLFALFYSLSVQHALLAT